MTCDWTDFADAFRWLLILLAAGWVFFAWLNRIEYRTVLVVLVGLLIVDWAVQSAANWVVNSDTNLPTDVPAFSTFILVAAIVGLAVAAWVAHKDGVSLGAFLDCALVVILVGAIGARTYHVFTHWDYYVQNADAIADLSQGGMGIRGGFALGLLALALFAPLRRVSFWKLGDAAAIGLSLALCIGWYGANLIGANYGAISDAPYAQDLPDLYGIIAPRVPVQWAAIVFFFLLFLVLAWFSLRHALEPGMILLVFLVLFGIGNFVLDSQRADETLHWNGWRIDQWVDLVLIGGSLLVLWLRNVSFHSIRRNERVEGEP